MEYPKSVMRISELTEMGFSENWLMRVYRRRNQTVAWKISPKRNSPILFDTDGLEKIRLAECGGGRGED